jgi:hypothetical protein
MRATRMIGITMATVALLAACGGGGGDKSDTDGSGSGSGSGTASPHEQMCQLAWEDGGKDQAAASGQSKADYMDECIKVMSGGATTTSAP